MLSFRIILSHIIGCLVIIEAAACVANAQPKEFCDSLLLKAELCFLSDSTSAGRGMGSASAQATTFYLFRHFRDLGLRTSVQSFSEGGKVGHNIVAVTRGWFKRYIVVGAYYDGLGKLGEAYYPGADSNASGVVAMLELARKTTHLCTGEVGLIFVGFDGHNASLAGSREFLAKYSSVYKIDMMVNLDILGSSLVPVRAARTDYIMILGGEKHRFSLENANRETDLHLSYDYYGSASVTELFYKKVSDQKWFISAAIPSLMFTSGITDHTNKVSDTIDKLDMIVYMKRISFIYNWLSAQL